MRPGRFQDFAVDLCGKAPGATRVRTLADAGDDKHPFGIAVTTGSGETRWQFIGQLPSGARHEDPDEPVHGTPPPASDAPRPDDPPEAWLAAVLAAAECPEIEKIERWSTREGERAGRLGLTLYFHNSGRVYVNKLG